METPLEKLNAKVFQEHLHTKFKVQSGNTTLTLELDEVTERAISPKIEAFSLIFHGPAAPQLPQMIHKVEHDKLGSIQIFLTAIAGDAEGILYEAVFNRIKKK